MSIYVSASGKVWCSPTGGVKIPGDLPTIGEPANPSNFMVFGDAVGSTTEDYPLQIARPFDEGEIADFPTAVIGGVTLPTQAHVEQRWPDGSVKHAVMFFHIPSVASGGSGVIGFANQLDGNTTGGLSAATVLASWDFNAVTELVNTGVTRTLSARTMLAAGHYEVMYSGSIATQFIIADHSDDATYDTGFGSALTAVRPVFHATFWPLTSQTLVRYIVESGCKTQEVANTIADTITLKLGNSSPATVYTKGTSTNMNYASRWTKTYWKGGTPPAINLNHNLSYLRSTTLVPNWDTDRVIPEATLVSRYSTWTAASKDLYGAGNWAKQMDVVGGRHDIGLAPGWVVWWLFSGDYRMKEMAFGNADLAAAFSMHLRESQYGRTRKYSRNGTTDAGGKTLSVNTRPTLFILNSFLNGAGTVAGDKFTAIGTLDDNGWDPDCSHQPDPYMFLYLLSGDFFYLEQGWFWAGYSSCYRSPANVSYGSRGPAGYYGGMSTSSEPRAAMWAMRSRARVAAYTPDRFADEKEHYTTLVHDYIEIEEGMRALVTDNVGTTLYNWGYNTRRPGVWRNGVVDPHHTWDSGVTQAPQDSKVIEWNNGSLTAGGASGNAADDVTYRVCGGWQTYFAILIMGHLKELGFPTEPLLTYAAKFITDYVTDDTRTPYWMATFLRPYLKLPAPGTYFTDWNDIQSGYNQHLNNGGVIWNDAQALITWNAQVQDTTHGYANSAMAAAAAVYSESGGEETWEWMETNARNSECLARLNNDPKWALVPREITES